MPRHSIIVPAYNAAATVSATIASALAQTVTDIEVIVVDDGSTDDTAAVVSSFDDERVRLIGDGRNRGLSGARNLAMSAATGEYLSFLDADDLWLPSYLDAMRAALEARPEAGVAACDAWRFQSGTGRIYARTYFGLLRPPRVPQDARGMLLEHLAENWFYVGATIRRQVFERTGGFSESLAALEDWEYWLRIQLSGYALAEVAQPLALYRVSMSQMSANAHKMANAYIELFEMLERAGLPDAEAAAVVARRKRGAYRYKRALERPLSMPGLRRFARAARARVIKRVAPSREWMKEPPAAVGRAFPDLA